MKSRALVWLCLVTLFGLTARPACAVPACDDAPLQHWSVKLGTLYPGQLANISVEVVDKRPWINLLAGGLIGGKADKGKGIYYPYMSQIKDEVALFTRDSAAEAVAALGLNEGPPVKLEIEIQQFQIDLYRHGGFSAMECIGYARFATTLRSESGEVLRQGSYDLTYFDYVTPKWKMNEVADVSLSHIFQKAAWETTIRELLTQFPQTAAPEALAALAQTVATAKKHDAPLVVFWLGLVGKGSAKVRETLEPLFHSSDDTRLAEAAAEALGMQGAAELREDAAAVLARKKSLSPWDIDDAHCAWYLLKLMNSLGESDLAAKVPAKEIHHRSALLDLARFVADGTIRTPTPAEVKGLAKAREEFEEDNLPAPPKKTKSAG